jgi:hypothetical protein
MLIAFILTFDAARAKAFYTRTFGYPSDEDGHSSHERRRAGPGALTPQLAAFFTSAAILASSAGVSSFNA